MASRKRKIKKNNKKLTAKLICLPRTKSLMASIFSSRTYVKFCNETTLHGLKHTVAKNFHWVERLLWFVLTCAAFLGAVYCALRQLSRYNSEPVVVSLRRDYRSWWTAFPAITACFLDRVQRSKAQDTIEMLWNVTKESDPERFQYYLGFVELVSDVSFRTNLQNFWKYQMDESVKGVDLLQLALDVHPTFPLKVMVSKQDKEVQWVPVMTEMGMCMTFNSEYAVYQFLLPNVEWSVDQLLKCHYLSGQCFVRVDSMNNAIRYFVHSPFDIPNALSNPTGEVMPGEELVMDFKAVEIQASSSVKNLRPEQRRCRYPDEWISSSIRRRRRVCMDRHRLWRSKHLVWSIFVRNSWCRYQDEWISNSIRAYSFGLCQMHCRSKMAIMFCGCRPFFHIKGDGEVCDAHGMACIGRNVEILINLPKNLAKCSCLPQCAELNYYSHTKKVVIRNGTEEEGDEGPVAAVRINLMPPKLRLHRDVIFTLEDLFASLGGTTALFVGASVLTVVETALFIIRHIVDFVIGRRTGRMEVLDYKN